MLKSSHVLSATRGARPDLRFAHDGAGIASEKHEIDFRVCPFLSVTEMEAAVCMHMHFGIRLYGRGLAGGRKRQKGRVVFCIL